MPKLTGSIAIAGSAALALVITTALSAQAPPPAPLRRPDQPGPSAAPARRTTPRPSAPSRQSQTDNATKVVRSDTPAPAAGCTLTTSSTDSIFSGSVAGQRG